ncbi:hypothetical protein LEP1GSC127_0493 [Leptospira kirschneri str. 200801925]|nr:hypothetical protein LEP1GSC127_0493 [Leptospira kirschneri str. 200801925]
MLRHNLLPHQNLEKNLFPATKVLFSFYKFGINHSKIELKHDP